MEERKLPHERLDVFDASIQLLEVCAAVAPVRGMADTMDQLKRACASVSLNIAEACGRNGKDRLRHFGIARGSLLEAAAAFKVLTVFGAIAPDDHTRARGLCDRLYSMLTRLAGY